MQLELDFATKPKRKSVDVHRNCRAEHWCFFVEALVMSTPIRRREGFVYAGETECGLVKVGKSIRQCPLCRMDQSGLDYLGLVWVPDASTFEQMLITAMGTPVQGHEWFDDPYRIRELIEDGWLHDVEELNMKIAVSCGNATSNILI